MITKVISAISICWVIGVCGATRPTQLNPNSTRRNEARTETSSHNPSNLGLNTSPQRVPLNTATPRQPPCNAGIISSATSGQPGSTSSGLGLGSTPVSSISGSEIARPLNDPRLVRRLPKRRNEGIRVYVHVQDIPFLIGPLNRQQALHKLCLVYRVISSPRTRVMSGGSSFPQQIPQFPVSRPVPPQQGGGRPPSNQQQGIQGQITPGMISLPGQQQWNPNLPAPSFHQRPDAPGSSFPSQSNTGGSPPFPQQVPQIPQLPASRPTTPQQNGGNAIFQSSARNTRANKFGNDAIACVSEI
ncbi:hypothetical protein MTO96_033479 [Rhipicephalus appendiculatus]